MTDRMTKIATASSFGIRFLRNTILTIIGRIPLVEHALAKKLSELDNR